MLIQPPKDRMLRPREIANRQAQRPPLAVVPAKPETKNQKPATR